MGRSEHIDLRESRIRAAAKCGVYTQGMPIAQIAGPIGPFLDRVQQRMVPVTAYITCEYMATAPGDPAQIDSYVKMQLLRGINEVVTPKMESGQLQFRDLGEGHVTNLMHEFIAASRLDQSGVRVGNLVLQFGIDGRQPTPPKGQQQPRAPEQPQVHLHANIGGLNINASSHGGVDTAGLQNQLKDKAKSQIVWWGIGCGVLLVVGIGLAGLALYVYRGIDSAGGGGPAAVVMKWDGKSTLTCAGSDSLRVEGVRASLSGTAINASGNCHLTLVNVDVTAPTGVEAGGNAVVTVQGGSITSTVFAVHATVNAKVNVTGSRVTGRTQTTMNAKITGV
jgi:hypothetical protein